MQTFCDIYTVITSTPIGNFKLISTDKLLLKAEFTECQQELQNSCRLLEAAMLQLYEYFDGKREQFELPLEHKAASFNAKVWEQISNIGFGQRATYLQIAKNIGHLKAARAVANGCGANPLAIFVPCHRVIRSDGTFGGYSGGREKKEWLLRFEMDTKVR